MKLNKTHLKQERAKTGPPPSVSHGQEKNLDGTARRSTAQSQETPTPSHSLLWTRYGGPLPLTTVPTGLQKPSTPLTELILSSNTAKF